MTTLPLIAAYDPQAPLWQRGEQTLTQAAFVRAALRAADVLSGDGAVLNLCESREAFALTFAACAIAGRPMLLPPSVAPAALQAIAEVHGVGLVVGDRGAALPALRCLPPPAIGATDRSGDDAVPQIAADAIVAIPFTSGSTGAPQPHPKRWDTLVKTAQLARQRLLPAEGLLSLLATVPPQHMYGLETSIIYALAAGVRTHTGRPLFPADIVTALEQLPPSRVLVTTPLHLRALVASAYKGPALVAIISATAPLSPALAAAAESRFGAPVHEIYGCTEAGSLASRRTAEDQIWRPYDDTTLTVRDGGAILRAAHLPDAVWLHDRIALRDGGFELLGRSDDVLKVAGKRMSAADLTRKLLLIPGVEDGVIVPPDANRERLAALVVAPQLSEAQILAALATQIDVVFLPRPLRRVAQLPRNAIGKLPAAEVAALLAGPATP